MKSEQTWVWGCDSLKFLTKFIPHIFNVMHKCFCAGWKLGPKSGQFIETPAVPVILKQTKLILFLLSLTASESTSRTGRSSPAHGPHSSPRISPAHKNTYAQTVKGIGHFFWPSTEVVCACHWGASGMEKAWHKLCNLEEALQSSIK